MSSKHAHCEDNNDTGSSAGGNQVGGNQVVGQLEAQLIASFGEVRDDLLDTDDGSCYITDNLYVEGAIFCNNVSFRPPPASAASNVVPDGATNLAVIDTSNGSVPVLTNVTPVTLKQFTMSQVNANEMLNVECGSKLVMSNLYVDGTIFCNKGTSAIIVNTGGAVGTGSGGGGGGGGGASAFLHSDPKWLNYGAMPVRISSLYVERVHFQTEASLVFEPALPAYRPSNDPKMLLLGEDLYYDGAWTLSLDLMLHEHEHDQRSTTLVGNGKLVALSSPCKISGVDRLVYNGPVRYEAGRYDGNTYSLFQPFDVSFFEKPITRTTVAYQTLNMHAGVLTTSACVEQLLNTATDVFVARHLPYCALQTVRLSPLAPMETLLVRHTVTADEFLREVSFNNNTVYNPRLCESGIYMLSARGVHETLGEVCCVTAYVFDACIHENLGLNVSSSSSASHFSGGRRSSKVATQSFRLLMLEPSSSTRFHMLHVVLSAKDFPQPVEEARRIALTVFGRERTLTSSVCKVREAHVHAWGDAFKTCVTLSPKCAASDEQKAVAQALKKHLRYSLYSIYSLTRLNATQSLAVMNEGDGENYPIADLLGTALNGGDLFLVPLLAMLKPETALAVLEFRWRNLQHSIRLAGSYGFEGAKISHSTDIVGYSAQHWDAYSSLTLYNSALVVVTTWNVYRLLRNADWLRAKGYPMMSALTTFLCGVVREREDCKGSDAHASGQMHTPKTCGVGGAESVQDNAFTNRTIKLAARYTAEAAFELNIAPDERWVHVAQGLPIPRFHNKVTKFDACQLPPRPRPQPAAHPAGHAHPHPPPPHHPAQRYSILEPLLLHVPLFRDLADQEHEQSTFLSMDLAFWARGFDFGSSKEDGDEDMKGSAVAPGAAEQPLNLALLAMAYGRKSQEDACHLDRFEQSLTAFVARVVRDPGSRWGNPSSCFSRARLTDGGRRSEAEAERGDCCRNEAERRDSNERGCRKEQDEPLPDPIVCALLLSTIIESVTNMHVAGGVAETRFYYEEMLLRSQLTANMPRYWDKVQVCGAGKRSKVTLKTLNQMGLGSVAKFNHDSDDRANRQHPQHHQHPQHQDWDMSWLGASTASYYFENEREHEHQHFDLSQRTETLTETHSSVRGWTRRSSATGRPPAPSSSHSTRSESFDDFRSVDSFDHAF